MTGAATLCDDIDVSTVFVVASHPLMDGSCFTDVFKVNEGSVNEIPRMGGYIGGCISCNLSYLPLLMAVTLVRVSALDSWFGVLI